MSKPCDDTKVTVLPIGVMEGGKLVTIEQLTAERDAWKAAVSGLVETKSLLIGDVNRLTAERDAL
jgi:hypothetical protein